MVFLSVNFKPLVGRSGTVEGITPTEQLTCVSRSFSLVQDLLAMELLLVVRPSNSRKTHKMSKKSSFNDYFHLILSLWGWLVVDSWLG